jgi:hypothetical protein
MHACELGPPGVWQEQGGGAISGLPFDQRACFIAGPAKSGTTLLTALLDGHPELLVLPEETAYFPTALRKYAGQSRRAQFDYLTQHSLANVLFGAPCKWGVRDYSHFSTRDLLAAFAQAAFAPANAQRDLLVLLLESYARVLGRPLDEVRYWVEKTPANRDHLGAIFSRFPQGKVLLTIRDPRALLAAQIQLEKNRRLRRFSVYLTVKHWRTAARLALEQEAGDTRNEQILVVGFSRLLQEPDAAMRRVCAFLDIDYRANLLRPTKIGRLWTGNSSAQRLFQSVSTEPLERWRTLLSREEIGWVEWHCREWMEALGYEPLLSRRALRHWACPVRGETPKEYLKSRLYSWRQWKRT